MREKLVLQSLADLGTGTAIRIIHYIEESMGHELSAGAVAASLRWLQEQGHVAMTQVANRQLFQLTKEGKRVAREGE